MVFDRPYSRANSHTGSSGPSDDMLALDATTEFRSFSMIYDRYAERLYRFLLAGTGSERIASELLDRLVLNLPSDLHRYSASEYQSFAGWLFGRAARQLETSSNLWWRAFRAVRNLGQPEPGASGQQGMNLLQALSSLPATEREVIAAQIAAGLSARQASEALSLPTSLVSHHLNLGLKSLAGKLESTGSEAMQQRLSDQFASVHLPQSARDRHRSSVSRHYHGEEEETRSGGSLARDLSVLALVAVLGLVGLYTWDRATSWYETWTAEPEEVVEIASQPPPTPTPVATVTPEPEPTPDPHEMFACRVDGRAILSRFWTYFEQGDFASLEAMIAEDLDAYPQVAESAAVSGRFVHGHERLDSRDEFVALLEERYAQNERWEPGPIVPAARFRDYQEAAPLEMYDAWRETNPALDVLILPDGTRTADNTGEQSVQVRVVVDCVDALILTWSMRVHDRHRFGYRPVADYLAAFESLDPGETRTVRLHVTTDERRDGGLLREWTLDWRVAMTDQGDRLEAIDIARGDNPPEIRYRSDGLRWSLDQRGWRMQGRSEPASLPEEISLVLPWFSELDHILAEHLDLITPQSSMVLRGDLSYTVGLGTERRFEVEIESGALVEMRLRRLTMDGEADRPRARFIEVSREADLSLEHFAVERMPLVPDDELTPSRYLVPDQHVEKLDVIALSIDSTQQREEYRISWSGVEIDLVVKPSRGGLDPASVPVIDDPSWQSHRAEYGYGEFVWAHRHFAGFPTDALWDTGRYRFELTVDRDTVGQDGGWDLGELNLLIDHLSGIPSDRNRLNVTRR